jgi:hypothetical protein
MKKILILFVFASCNEANKPDDQPKNIEQPKKESSVIINMENSNGNSISVTQDDTTIVLKDSL